jgi:hypothetical protein
MPAALGKDCTRSLRMLNLVEFGEMHWTLAFTTGRPNDVREGGGRNKQADEAQPRHSIGQ